MPSTMRISPDLAASGRKAERQREILEAVVGAFSPHGYHHRTISGVALEAGILRPDVGIQLIRRGFFGAVHETVSSWCLRPERRALRKKAEPLLEVLLNGMLLKA